MKRLPRISAVAILFLVAPVVAVLVAMPLLWCIRVWHWPDSLVALLGCVFSAGLMYVVWRFVVELIAQRFRFTLRMMIVAIAVLGLVMGTIGSWWIRFAGQYRTFHELMAYGAMFDSARYGSYSQRHKTIYRWFGYDPFETSQDLRLTNDRALKEALRRPEDLRDIAQLSFDRGATAAGFAEATGFDNLPAATMAQFIDSNIDATGLARLAEWTKLRELFFNGCAQVDDAGLTALASLPNLESLALVEEGGGMKIGDAGLAHVGDMRSLKKLMLLNMPNMTDAGFAHLHELSSLEALVVRRTGLTTAGLRQLHEALPDCRIETDVEDEGPRNVRQVLVRGLSADMPTRTIADSKTIAALLQVTDAIRQGNLILPRDEQQPRPAEFELTFNGASRMLWQLRFDSKTLQELNVHKVWNRWPLSPEQAAELKELAGLEN